jgi:DNA polymerase III subunit alpha
MPQNVPFVHLHFHTEYSLLDGCCRVGAAVENAKQMGMNALAITDHGVMYGAIDFYKKAKDAGIKPIIGCEAYMAHGSMLERRREEETGSQANHQLLLCETNEGYANLMRLVSMGHLQGFYYKPRIDLETLAKYHKGLIATSSCLNGQVPAKILRGDMAGALQLAGTYAEIFGKGNYFIELQNHTLEEQAVANRGLLEIAKKLALPLIVTNDVHYLKPEDAEAHEVMLCMQTGTTMSDPKRLRYGSTQFYMKSGAEMLALFRDYPEALANTVDIAERCHLELKLKGELHFPTYIVPEGYTQKEYLIKLGREGLKQRYGIEDVHHPRNDEEAELAKRFFYELEIIEKTGFINYFLVVWDFIHYAHENRIPVGPGRGSGAGSVVAYALAITGIDPLRYGLIFERFLNPDRVSPPDFDIDFCQWRRGEVIDYVKRKYGEENVAQIITFGSLGPKTVIRDLARVLELPLADADRLAKMIPEAADMNLDKALKESPDFRRACESEPAAQRIMKYARVLEGLPRNPGIHAAGVVIGEKPLIEILPLAKDKSGAPCTQYEMKPLEMVGLLKMDFLGLKTLTIVQEAVDAVERNHGVKIDLDRLPMDDKTVLDMLSRGDTVAVFQVESKGMRDAAQDRRGPVRGPDRAHRAVPPRPDAVHGRLRQPEERPVEDRVSAPEAGGRAQGDLRHHRLPGAGAAGGQRAGGVHARAGRFAAPRDGQEEQGRDGVDARQVRRGLREAQPPAGDEGRGDFRLDRQVRGVRLQQVAQRGVRGGELADGVAQDALPVGIHGGQPVRRDQRQRAHRRAAGGVPGAGDRDPAAERERERRALHRAADGEGRAPRDPLRHGGREERGAGRGGGHRGGAHEGRPVQGAARLLRAHRQPAREPEDD